MSKKQSFEQIKKFLLKEKKKYDKQMLSASAKEEAKNERAAAKLAKMKDFSLYSDDKFDAASELGLTQSYNEGSWDSNWN
tara:strand:+ start:670 stop:909 length:240 start_codon:yes stop_codon:yes gene_type:complete